MAIEVKKNKLGWGGVVRFTTQPYAVFIDGEPLVATGGRIRTFGSREAATKAAQKHLEERACPIQN